MTMSSSGGSGLHGGTTLLSGGGGGYSSSSVSVSSGGVGVGGGSGSVAFARKTNTARSSAAASGNSMIMALSALGGGAATYAGTHGDLGANPKSVIQRRDREKHDINDLNVKLAEYIEQNGWYRIKVKEQEKLILKMKTEFEAIEVRLRGIYDVEMANLRATIDATAREKAAVELKVDTLETLYKDFRAKYEAELSAHESTRLRLPKLEREISEKDAQIDFLAKTLSSLEPQVSALKAQISTYQKESIEAKMGADAEIVARVELESKLVTKQDEIDFIKKIYEEKLKMALDFDFDSDATYSNDLAEALKDIRAEYQAQLEAISGGADETWFQQKFDMMMTTSKKQGAELTMARDEVTAIKAKYNELMTRVSTFDAQILALKETISQREADLVNEKKMSAVALADRDAQIAEFKRQIAAHILELKGLMDAKLSLDEEIAVYRRLLLAGGSTTTKVVGGGAVGGSVVSGGSTITTSITGGSSTVLTGGSSSSAVTEVVAESSSASTSSSMASSAARTTFSATSHGKGAIAETSTDGRFIVIENKTGASLDLSGWKIERCVDMGDLVVYGFPAGTTIGAGGSLRIWASGVAGATAGAGNLIWAGGNSWGIGFNATNELKNALGGLEASLTQKTTLG